MAIVSAQLGDGTRVDLEAREHRWQGDEPAVAGGTDTGPTPYELLLGSLAACISVTLRLYARHKGIDLAGVGVRLAFDRVHADDCEDCDERAEGWIDHIQTQVTIHGSFSDAQKVRLAQVAGRCPVHKTLANGVHISDSVTFAAPPSRSHLINPATG